MIGLEWTSVVLNIGFTILIAYQRRWGWLCGFLGSALAVWLYAVKGIIGLTALQVFFALAGLYGYWNWGKETERPVMLKSIGTHSGVVIVGLGMVYLTATLLQDHLDGQFPYMDAFVTVFSIVGTVLMAWRWLNHWIYWVVVDLVWLVLNLKLEYYSFATLSVVYLVLSVFGWVKWKKELRSSTPSVSA